MNAGSMADIAFLLLIFFLVTTQIATDSGLDRMLPPMEPPENMEDVVLKQKNIFTVNINKRGQLLVEEQLMDIKDLRQAAIDFLDNGGSPQGDPKYCSYCKGKRDPNSSDNPQIAVISLQNDRETKYSTYVTVQNELVAAYNDLRNREAQRIYGRDFTEMDDLYSNPETPKAIRDDLKDKVKRIQDLYPQKLSEAETKSN